MLNAFHKRKSCLTKRMEKSRAGDFKKFSKSLDQWKTDEQTEMNRIFLCKPSREIFNCMDKSQFGDKCVNPPNERHRD